MNRKVSEALEELTEKSAFYSRLVSDLFKETVVFKGKRHKIFDLVGDILESRKLFLNMSVDVVAKI